MDRKKIFVLILVSTLIILFFIFDLGKFLTFEYIQNSQESFSQYYEQNKILTIILFFVIYVLVAALSIPGAAIMTVLAGALFGLIIGVLVVSFASTIGATIAMLFSRYVFSQSVEKKFPEFSKKINKGVDEEGAFYLFSIRLVPIIPFFVVNLAMGLTKINIWTFFWVSQLGMFLGTIIYVNAGSELSKISSLDGILSPTLLFAFVLIGILPLALKYVVNKIQNRTNSK